MAQVQHPGQQMPARHSQYEPFPWIFYIRIAQFVLSIVIIGLSGYAASQSFFAAAIGFSFWAIVWTIIYVPVVTFFVPKVTSQYRPNIIVLVVECFSWFWWLITFATLASLATLYTLGGLKKRYTYSTSYDDVYSDAYGAAYSQLKAVSGCVKAAAALSAINYVLFKVTFIAICIKIHKQRKERLAEHYQHGVEAGNSGAAIEVSHITNDKTDAEVQVQPVRQY